MTEYKAIRAAYARQYGAPVTAEQEDAMRATGAHKRAQVGQSVSIWLVDPLRWVLLTSDGSEQIGTADAPAPVETSRRRKK